MLDGMPQVMWFIRRHMRRHRASGLSVPQFRTLVLLDRYPKASLSLVADNLGAALPTASRMVAGMVRKGLVRREVCAADRRQVSLGLTPKGRTAFEAARHETQNEVALRVSKLTPAQREMVAESMRLLGDLFAGSPAALAAEDSAVAEPAPDGPAAAP
ncbi:MAG: transcriptional regulator, MarR family [Phycisphaerales bacterium]|nr:transcriptional regulator, MarR family [Phycisphaerales bacterium]